MVRADIMTELLFLCCRVLEMPDVLPSSARTNEYQVVGKKTSLHRKDMGSTNQEREQVGHRSVGRSRKKL